MSEDTESSLKKVVKSTDNLSFLKPPPAKPLRARNEEDGNCSLSSATNLPQSQRSGRDISVSSFSSGNNNQKITIEYERVGSFQVFETICPLECLQLLPNSTTAAASAKTPETVTTKEIMTTATTATQDSSKPGTKDSENKTPPSAERRKKSKKDASTTKKLTKFKSITKKENNSKQQGAAEQVNPNNPDSDSSEDDMTRDFNDKLHHIETQQSPKFRSITLDAFFRTENPNSTEPPYGDASVFWARGDSLNIPSKDEKNGNVNGIDGESDSDLDPEIEKYILAQQEKKQGGENVTGESLWYDQERSIIRNLHENGSISLTSYGDTDEKIFGKTEIFDAILTCEERAILRAPNEDEPYVKIEKKEKAPKAESTKKKMKKQQQAPTTSSRPKDQGDWL